MRIGPLGLDVTRPGVGGWANLEVLRRRRYLAMLRLPYGRVFTCSWTDKR
jgi:hypothetical protein